MPRNADFIPSLRRHKGSSQAVVTLNGRDRYCGPWPAGKRKPPIEAKERYDRLIAEWLANGRQLPDDGPPDRTVAELLDKFWTHAEQHYRDEAGQPTHELHDIKYSLRPLWHLYSTLPASEFGPLKLKAVREMMVRGYTHPRYGEQGPLSRGVVNSRVRRIVHAFKWAVSEELIPGAVLEALRSVKGLERGRTEAYETQPVEPVPDAFVDDTLPFLSRTVRAMVELQRLTGMRSQEVCIMRTDCIDRSGPVWLYRPYKHKTQRKGKTRVIPLGPKAQAVLQPFLGLKLNSDAYVFSPADAVAEMRAERTTKRKTPATYGNRPGTNRKRKPTRQPGDHYITCSYASAVTKAIVKANAAAIAQARAAGQAVADDAELVPHWRPYQLRHSHGTEVRRKYGLEGAQVALGHSSADVTQVYAERDLGLAVKIAAECG